MQSTILHCSFPSFPYKTENQVRPAFFFVPSFRLQCSQLVKPSPQLLLLTIGFIKHPRFPNFSTHYTFLILVLFLYKLIVIIATDGLAMLSKQQRASVDLFNIEGQLLGVTSRCNPFLREMDIMSLQ